MSNVGIFIADGCEEIEALTVVDILRRGEIVIKMISITDRTEVTGAHQITFQTDMVKSAVDFSDLDGIILPGGMPGTMNLQADETVQKVIHGFAAEGKLVAAICAAPGVLGEAGLLQGKKAACYPGVEPKLAGAEVCRQPVVRDGNIITSRSMGTAIPFGLEIINYFQGAEAMHRLAESIVYPC